MQELVRIYQAFFADCDTVWDVGTRDGDDAAFLGQQLNAKSIVAFDANSTAVVATLTRHPHLTVVHTAISDYDGEAEFTEIISHNKDYAGCSSFTPNINVAGIEKKTHTVKVSRLRNYLTANHAPSLVKIDLEGYTYEALVGLGEAISRVRCFHLETEIKPQHEGAKTSADIYDFMIAQGFQLEGRFYEWAGVEDQVWINPRG